MKKTRLMKTFVTFMLTVAMTVTSVLPQLSVYVYAAEEIVLEDPEPARDVTEEDVIVEEPAEIEDIPEADEYEKTEDDAAGDEVLKEDPPEGDEDEIKGTGKKLQLGTAELNEKKNTMDACKVYFDSNSDKWTVVGYDGHGVAGESDKITLLAYEPLAQCPYDDTDPYTLPYDGSTLKSTVDSLAERLSPRELSAVAKRKLLGKTMPYGLEGYDENKIPGPHVENAVMWPLSVAEAKSLDYYLRDMVYYSRNYRAWWLRSPGKGKNMALVGIDGEILVEGAALNFDHYVRPAFHLDLSSVILTSAVNGGKDSGSEVGILNAVAETDFWGDELKLTVLDADRDGFTASAGTGAVLSRPEGYSLWTIPIQYTNALTGSDREHVSVILTDDNGNALYYGYVANNSGQGTESVTIPRGLQEGTYTLNVFSEEVNGDKKTDYASPIRTISIAVTEGEQVKAPAFEPAGGIYKKAQNVTISSETEGASIYYTTDGTEPTEENGLKYTSPVTVSEDTTIRAIAVKDDMLDSEIVSETYEFKVAAPEFSPEPKICFGPQDVTISCATTGATIFYTTDGTFPTRSSARYRSAITLSGTTTIRAFAVKDGLDDSEIVSVTYFFNKKIGIGPGGIGGPIPGEGGWSYVYYGTYNEDAMKYRVLDPAATEYGSDTMLLDCDNTIVKMPFDDDSNVWADSDIKAWLNGDEFLGDAADPAGAFTLRERNAIASSTKKAGIKEPPRFVPLEGERIFLLDESEAEKESYGFVTDVFPSVTRVKSGVHSIWWLRTPGSSDNVGTANSSGSIDPFSKPNDYQGVSPAFNIKLSSVVLASAAEGGKDPGTRGFGTLNGITDYLGNEWKLTVLDESRNGFIASANPGAVLSRAEGYTSWTVPVTYSNAKTGSEKEHVSVILSDGNGTALYYGYIATNSAQGTKSVTIPEGLEEGTYTLNVFSEEVNGDKKTDYAGPISTITLTVAESEQVKTPAFTPAGGTYIKAQKVTIYSATNGAKIYYTTDGSEPTVENGLKYDSPIVVSESMTIRAIAVKDGKTDSEVASATYTMNIPEPVATPTFDPEPGTYYETKRVTISCATDGADIRYTTDGSEPTKYSTRYRGAISVSETTTIKAIAVKSGIEDSEVASATYTLKVAAPVINPMGGTYDGVQSVTISCATKDAEIYYTTGSQPLTKKNGTKYLFPIYITRTSTVQAMAVKKGMDDSEIVSATFTKVEPEPHEHSYTSEVTSYPTCTQTGIRTYTCECGHAYMENIDALGHDYVSEITKEPTSAEEGVKTWTCTRCGDSYTETIPRLSMDLLLYEKVKGGNELRVSKKLKVGTSFTVVPVFAAGRVSNLRVVWSSSNPDVATVTQDGKVTAMSCGHATITVCSEEDTDLTASCDVTVTEPVTEVTVDKKSYSFGEDESVLLTAQVLPFTAAQEVRWSTSNIDVAVVCNGEGTQLEGTAFKSGKIYGKTYDVSDLKEVKIRADGEGSAKITVEAVDGSGKKATCSFTVGKAVPDNFTVSGKGNKTEVEAGKTLNMQVNWPDAKNKPKNTEIIWSLEGKDGSDAASIASITSKGVLTGITAGTVTVRATSAANKSRTKTADITVTKPANMKGADVTGISFTDKDKGALDKGLIVGKSYNIKPQLTTEGKGKASGDAVAWFSSDESVATVSQKGAVKAVGAGEVKITAVKRNADDLSTAPKDSVTFTVYAPLKSIKPDKTKLTLGTQDGAVYGRISVASFVPVDASDPSVEWKTNNDKVWLAAVNDGQSPIPDSFINATGSGLSGTKNATGKGVTVKNGQYLAIKAQAPGVVKLTGITKDGTNKKMTVTVTVRGQVSNLYLKKLPGKKSGDIYINDVTLDEDGSSQGDMKYTGSMKAGANMTLTPLVSIENIDADATDNTDKSRYSEYKKYTDVSVSYLSSDTSVATVDKKGKIEINKNAEENKTTTIYATTADGKQKAEITIKVVK